MFKEIESNTLLGYLPIVLKICELHAKVEWSFVLRVNLCVPLCLNITH